MMLQNEMPEKLEELMVEFEFQEMESIKLQQEGSVRRLYPPTNGTGSPGVRNGFLPNSSNWSINDSPRIRQLFICKALPGFIRELTWNKRRTI